MKNCIFLLLISSTIFSCKPSVLEPQEYEAWAREADNGLRQTVSVGHLEYTMTFKPIDVMILQSNEGVVPSQDSIIKMREEFAGLLYFTFQMKVSDNSSVLQFEGDENAETGRLQHFFGDMQGDFVLITGNDTLPCSIYHYERDYGVDPFETFSLGFEVPENFASEKVIIVYNDQVMNTGPVRFDYSSEELFEQPQLKF
jgi:hypothetical protein